MKYELPDSQKEVLPNLLGIVSVEALGVSEFEGFLKAEIVYTERLTDRTKFSVEYILQLHKLALGHLYSFAGDLRSVNMSKAGFVFAAARYLPCLLYTSDAADERSSVDLGGRRIIKKKKLLRHSVGS